VWLAVAIAFVVVAVVILVWFQPQKLVIDSSVNEAAPTAAPQATDGPSVIGTGSFEPLEHSVSGTASFVRTGDATTLRFEDFEVENGPDLVVYLSAGDPAGPGRALADDFVDLGPLKGNVGNQNYVVPANTDLERYDTAVVWCRRFTVAFAAAEIA
jgi:hypothetical protein